MIKRTYGLYLKTDTKKRPEIIARVQASNRSEAAKLFAKRKNLNYIDLLQIYSVTNC